MREKIDRKVEEVKQIQEEVKNISFDQVLNDMITEGQYIKTIKSVKGHVIKMKALGDDERALAFSLARFDEDIFDVDIDSMSDIEKIEFANRVTDEYTKQKRALLAYSIVEIDGVSSDEISKEEFFNKLKNYNADVLDLLYLEYRQTCNEHFENMVDIDSFKKKLKIPK